MSNIQNEILFLIEQASKSAKRFSQRILDANDLGITVEQWVILKIINEQQGLSQKELAQKSDRDAASITRTLDILERNKFLKRKATPGNRRQYRISITDYGRSFVEENTDLINSLRAMCAMGLSPHDLETLKELLIKVRSNME